MLFPRRRSFWTWLRPFSGAMLAASGAILLGASLLVAVSAPIAPSTAWAKADSGAALGKEVARPVSSRLAWTAPPGPGWSKPPASGRILPRPTATLEPRQQFTWLGEGNDPTSGTAGHDLRAALVEMAADAYPSPPLPHFCLVARPHCEASQRDGR